MGSHTCPYLFFMQLKKNNKKTTNKIQKKNLPENAVEAVEPYFGPENMFDCAFFAHR